MADHIFTASVKGYIATTRASARRAEEAVNRLVNQDSSYARECRRLAELHREVEMIWVRALKEANRG